MNRFFICTQHLYVFSDGYKFVNCDDFVFAHNVILDRFIEYYSQIRRKGIDSSIREKCINLLFALVHLDDYLFSNLVDLGNLPVLCCVDFAVDILRDHYEVSKSESDFD